MTKYRLLLQTTKRLYIVGGADIIGDFVPLMQRWLTNTIAGRSIYDDSVKAISLYVYDPATNSFQRRNTIPVSSRQAALNAIYGFVAM